MAPAASLASRAADEPMVGRPTNPDGLVLEAWAQGYMVGSLVIMTCITIANMRRGVLLHKLILIELIMGMFHGTFIFAHEPYYGWYLSSTAIFLNASWCLHNIIAWLKNKPFLSRKVSIFYITTVVIALGYWVLEIYANFAFFNNINRIFLKTRPWEALFRDPWWIFTTINLIYNIHTRYDLSVWHIVRISPRFGVLLASMLLSILFIIVDILAVTRVFNAHALPDGINPFWKLAFVFKCLTDTIVLDDFKTALDRLSKARKRQLSNGPDALEDGNVEGVDGWAHGWKGVGSDGSPKEGKARRMSPATQRVEDIKFADRDEEQDVVAPLSLEDALRLPRRLESGHSERRLI
ncbi:hypothetical protein DIS24_g2239 [Lasiodiplodia hormozganensis]|uniref:Uncharacterized protein n=1 Tax=Lasiodiplodia hormozganensis TaxID=869390 RepID=A0AA39Z0I1_9PEZI|nr:hypothetical protein DIS24_g2239 [Lasiodiplodia hormozganensis]